MPAAVPGPLLARRSLLAAAGMALAGPALAAAAPASPVLGQLAEGGFDPETFRQWVAIRAGTGGPVFWYSQGTIRAFPSGELLAFMEGFDAARAHWPEPGALLAHQYNRKIYIFRDRRTGEPLSAPDGTPAPPIAYPYQFISYRLAGDRVETFVEQGAGARLTRIGPGTSMAVRRQGRTLVFTAPLFLDLPTGPSSRMQAFENYDFVADPAADPSTYVLSWLRTGSAPPALGGGPAVMHLVTRRHERFADMPETIRAYVLAEAPLWQAPPADLAEIRRLQAG